MGYETAPATLMLATNCACCGKALVDSTSVETGVGPDCRKEYGYTEAQGAPDWTAVARSNPFDCPAEEIARDARKLCNRLVYRAAAGADQAMQVRIAQTVHHLGYVKLGEKLMSRATSAVVTVENGRIKVKTPKKVDAFVEASRQIPGRWYVAEEKATTFPYHAKVEVWAMLRKVFKGGVLMTPKGIVPIE